jgi:DNA polymerase-4
MTRKILHLDLDAFFCAVEELHDPSLKGKPFAVGGRADQRGVVASCSYAARQFGVRSAMPMSRAQQLCPDLIVVSSRHGNYSEVAKKVMKIIEITPFIERISIDEAFLEVTGLPESLIEIARDLQHQVNSQLDLPISIGGGTSKLIAKIANDWGKSQKKTGSPPNTITIIPPGEEEKFLAPLPVQFLSGVGPKTAEKLAEIGITTIGALAKASPEALQSRFGQYSADLQQRAMGIDHRPIETEHDIKSISNEVTFPKDLIAKDEILQTLRSLSEQVGRRLRKASLAGATIQIKLRWSDFTTITRQTTLVSPTNLDAEIYGTAKTLFESNWSKGKPVRLIGIGLSGLGPPVHQLSLWEDDYQKETDLLNAVDKLKERYGSQIITRARNLRSKEDQTESNDNTQ